MTDFYINCLQVPDRFLIIISQIIFNTIPHFKRLNLETMNIYQICYSLHSTVKAVYRKFICFMEFKNITFINRPLS